MVEFRNDDVERWGYAVRSKQRDVVVQLSSNAPTASRIAWPSVAIFLLPLVFCLPLLLVPAWMAVVELQDNGALGLAGPWALRFVLVWVWAADTGAYFAGRAFGRRKLAPAVSPGKTVEGLLGGVALALVVVAAVFYTGWLDASLPALMVVALLTVLASVLGDLFESMAKRQRGIKDSGNGVKEGVLEAMKFFTNVKTYSLPWPR